MKNLLVTIGVGENASNTLQYAIDFAEKFKSKVYAFRLYESTRISGSLKNIDVVLQENVTKEINKVISKVDRKKVEIKVVSAKGHLIDSIETLIKELSIDLIICSSKSISTDESLFLGKVSGSIVKDSSAAVLVIPPQYRYKDISKVLMAVRSGKAKDSSLTPLKNILEFYKAKLDLLQVITHGSSEEEKQMNEEIKKMADFFKKTENATVFQGVLEHLHITEPDMLCVIRKKRGFFSRLWKEDVVKKANFESRLPLLVLKSI